MTRTLRRRLDELEARHSPTEPRALWICLVSKEHGNASDGWRVPAIGWRYGDVDILRMDGESDEALQQRALDHAKTQGEQAFMMFRQISKCD
ncbi:hypothetical protein [Geoalkalibacter subterraneus]|jgi:hypothetical protein|uniref:Uncharacterized protein n=1 Tax=Geoalkalibacter subterraneus TaxID=483547 RepID=A0A0B5FW29_9BACT|nr:hypothetical protein [Geoalkalibacter subterraneus]AJF07796.1 hypothetical protein GSUB_16260 [Geoalkalibacter subterraneus]